MTQRKQKSRYRIVITERTFERQIIGHDWVKNGNSDKPDEFGYTPEIEKSIPVERKVFEQDVEKLDLKAVIRAINDMGPIGS